MRVGSEGFDNIWEYTYYRDKVLGVFEEFRSTELSVIGILIFRVRVRVHTGQPNFGVEGLNTAGESLKIYYNFDHDLDHLPRDLINSCLDA